MTDFYPHVYLSPHLDDAVLSCGGLIHQQVAAGQRPLVVTIFAGSPPRDEELSDFARFLHERDRNPDLVTARLAEDQAALAVLGADYLRLAYLDCIYRGRPHAGEAYYPSGEALFGAVHPAEAGLPDELAAALAELIPADAGVTLYAPLTVGNHVDHQLTFAAARSLAGQGWKVRFYEDYPYVEREAGALEAALAARGIDHWQPAAIPLNEDDLAAKIAAIACYRTQVDVLFGVPGAMPGEGARAMPGRIRAYAARVGGERLGTLQPGV
jgi:LmbE family N-acetylglucosaminyl deacetylase